MCFARCSLPVLVAARLAGLNPCGAGREAATCFSYRALCNFVSEGIWFHVLGFVVNCHSLKHRAPSFRLPAPLRVTHLFFLTGRTTRLSADTVAQRILQGALNGSTLKPWPLPVPSLPSPKFCATLRSLQRASASPENSRFLSIPVGYHPKL